MGIMGDGGEDGKGESCDIDVAGAIGSRVGDGGVGGMPNCRADEALSGVITPDGSSSGDGELGC